MEQTTALSTQLAGLPAIIEANKSLHEKAVMIVQQKMDAIKAVDFVTLDITAGDTIDNELAELQSKMIEAIDVNKQRRSPITKAFDDFRSMFTSQEKSMTEWLDYLKLWRSNWNKEKYNRRQEEERQRQIELNKKNAATDYQASITMAINDFHTANLKDWITKLSQAFYSVPLEGMEEYELRLRGYAPQLAPFQYTVPDNTYITLPEMAALKEKVQGEMYPVLNNHFVEEMTKERDRLILMIPSRIEELRRIAANPEQMQQSNERIFQEQADRMQELDAQAKNMADAATATAETEKMNNLYDATPATQAITLSKGTSLKQKYNPTTHKAMVAIIQQWVAKEMNKLTMEELTKKLSFMVAAANKSLNAGEVIQAEGLLIEEDLTVRGKRS